MDILLFPPVTFALTLAFGLLIDRILAPLAPAPDHVPGSGKRKPYACGEDVPAEKVIPDYQEFFPFAIFFTLLHVAGLIIATWSLNPLSAGLEMVTAYILSVAVILAILFVG